LSGLIVRPLEAADHSDWRRLWTAYLAFYETAVAEEVYETTWRRLFDQGMFEPKGLLAVIDGQPAGLVHYIFHRTCWSARNTCYLQDLYADPDVRGRGVGRALIEAVYARADEAGAANVYWLTQEFNETGRRLYDRVGRLTPFLKYQRS
jgi:GNAT superfamily N-acetyltransferase